jgi:uncharacterized protein (TIGR03437 family)
MGTYLPGLVWSIALDRAGNAFVAIEQVLSSGQEQLAVVMLDPSGLKATVFPVFTCNNCIGPLVKTTIDGGDNVYFAGTTNSSTFPVTAGVVQTTLRSKLGNGFIVKYNLKTAKVIYATYLGGSGQENYLSLAADTAGNAYVAGQTTSADFPVTSGAYETKIPFSDNPGFVTKLSVDGSALVYSTYFDSGIYNMMLDPAGGAFLGAGGVLAKLSSDGGQVVSSTNLDLGFGAFDLNGNIVGVGSTLSTSYPGVNPLQLVGTPAFPFQYRNCTYDNGQGATCICAILGKLDPQGKVIWSSMIGGEYYIPSRPEGGIPTGVNGVATDSSGNVYAAISNFGLIKVEPVGPAPLLVTGGVVSSAGFQPDIAAGGLVSIFGTGLTTAKGIVAAPSFPLPTTLEDTSITILGEQAPLLAVANVNGQEQVNVQAPLSGHGSGVGGLGLGTISVRRGRALGYANVSVQPLWPSIFTGTDGQPAVSHADYSLVTAANPAHVGEAIVIWSTGGGAVTPPVPVGMAASGSPDPTTVTAPVVTVGGQNAATSFSGLAPGYVGLYQINVTVPPVPAGQTQLSVAIPNYYQGGGPRVTSTVAISIR